MHTLYILYSVFMKNSQNGPGVVNVVAARKRLGEYIDRVTYTERPLIITKSGNAAVAVVPVWWLERLGYSPSTGHPL